MSQIVIDSNYFLAVNNSHDSLNLQAVKLSYFVEKNEAIISDYIFLEIVTILSQKVSRNVACQVGLALLSSANIKIITVDHSLFLDSWIIFSKLKQKNISFIDCSILATMKRYRVKQLLSFDNTDFAPLQKQFGFELMC